MKSAFNMFIRTFKHSIVIVLLVVQACSNTSQSQQESKIAEPVGVNNLAYKWGRISLECTANDTERFNPRPTVTSRMLALIWISVFDAWSRYDPQASPLYLNSVPRRPGVEQTVRNKEVAISYAAYRAMLHYFYADSTLLRTRMTEFGLDPDNISEDPSTAIGIGNLAAKVVIESRMSDGSNQKGDLKVGGTPYSDYSNYIPANTADELIEIEKWQPKYFSDGKGGKFAPGCLTPHWGKVQPLALDSGSQFRPVPPPSIGSKKLEQEVQEVVDLQANLTNDQKALVEFMRDGPKSVQQAGHWLVFAQNVSVRDKHTLDEDVKLYFLVEMAAMDAFIASWDAKMFYDFARPYALVHYYLKDQLIDAWGGPTNGMTKMKANEWRPYSPDTFLCPPFPSYVSGHSSVSGACAEVMRLYTGSDTFGEKVKIVPGLLTEPEKVGDTVVLDFKTFTETANLAGRSRVLGGYHIESDNIEGLRMGRKVAHAVWQKYQEHIKGNDEMLSKLDK
jgi:hypothetical protein